MVVVSISLWWWRWYYLSVIKGEKEGRRSRQSRCEGKARPCMAYAEGRRSTPPTSTACFCVRIICFLRLLNLFSLSLIFWATPILASHYLPHKCLLWHAAAGFTSRPFPSPTTHYIYTSPSLPTSLHLLFIPRPAHRLPIALPLKPSLRPLSLIHI